MTLVAHLTPPRRFYCELDLDYQTWIIGLQWLVDQAEIFDGMIKVMTANGRPVRQQSSNESPLLLWRSLHTERMSVLSDQEQIQLPEAQKTTVSGSLSVSKMNFFSLMNKRMSSVKSNATVLYS